MVYCNASTVKKVLNLDIFQLKKRMIYIYIIMTFSGLLGSFVFFYDGGGGGERSL